VITLSGNVLFASNKSQLLPGAQNSLSQVAEAIKPQDDKKVLNRRSHRLARLRRDEPSAVQGARRLSRAFLTTQGVTPDRITTAGLGPSRPVC